MITAVERLLKHKLCCLKKFCCCAVKVKGTESYCLPLLSATPPFPPSARFTFTASGAPVLSCAGEDFHIKIHLSYQPHIYAAIKSLSFETH